MSEPFLSANPLLSQNDSNSHRANMFQALMGSSEAVPLDSSGIFSLIRTNRYRQLVVTLTQGQSIKQKIEQQCHLLTLTNIELKKQTSLYKERLQLYQQNQQKLELQINSLSQQLRQSNLRLLEVEDQLRREKLSTNKGQPGFLSFQGLSRKPDTRQSDVQTCWEEQHLSSLEKDSEVIMQPEKDDSQKMEQKLYQILRQNAETFQQEFKERLKKLEECQMTLENWQKEKEELRQENQRLRQQAHLQSLQDEKIKVWQKIVGDFMQNIQKNILESKPEDLLGNQDNKSREDWEREALERGKLAELRLRIREAEQQMQVDEKGDEDGPVVTLVRLSQQVKSIVRGMLIQSEYS